MDTFTWFSTHWTGFKGDLIKLKRWSADWDQLQAELRATEQDRRQLADCYLNSLELLGQQKRAAPLPNISLLLNQPATAAQRMAASAQVLSFPGTARPQPGVRSGDVREMPALAAAGQTDGCRVLVMAPVHADDPFGNWHVIPFSPLNEPASDEEWRMEDPEGELAEIGCSVLCFWNHFELPVHLLENAATPGTFNEEEREELQQLWQVYRATAALPCGSRRGASIPGLLDNDDPRAAYYAHSRAGQPWQHLIEMRPAFSAKPQTALPRLTARAGIPHQGQPSDSKLHLQDSTDILHLRLEGRMLHLEFQTQDGERALHRDHSILIATNGWATRFQGGRASGELRQLREGFMLINQQGRIIAVESGQG